MIEDPNNAVGMQFGIYLIKSCTGNKDIHGHWLYEGECQACGFRKIAALGDFRSPSKVKNACRHIGITGSYIRSARRATWRNRRIRHIYHGMRGRCYSPNNKDYANYGGKGIKICKEWLNNPVSFEEWALSNGYTDDMTIDRVDPNGDYSPGNCRWVTPESNSRYKSTTRLIQVDGESHTGRQWAAILGVSTNKINNMVRNDGVENTVNYIRRMYIKPVSVPG